MDYSSWANNPETIKQDLENQQSKSLNKNKVNLKEKLKDETYNKNTNSNNTVRNNNSLVENQGCVKMCSINARSICNKTTIISELVLDNDFDLVAITETWIKKGDEQSICDMTPTGYSFKHIDRIKGRAGGVGLLHKNNLTVTMANNSEDVVTSFEYIKCSVTAKNTSYNLTVIYRPPTQTNKFQTSTFFVELNDLLMTHLTTKGKLIICGDFNFHMDNSNDLNTRRLNSILNEHSLSQHIQDPTHNSGHTLDLLITRKNEVCINSVEVTDMGISDHFGISFHIDIPKPHVMRKTVNYRELNKINKDDFRSDIRNSFASLGNLKTEDLVHIYNANLETILNNHAPLKSKEILERQDAKWYNNDISLAKCERRRLERKWRLTRTEYDRDAYRQQNKTVNKKIISAKMHYYCIKINDAKSDQKCLYKIVNNLMHRRSQQILPTKGTKLELCNRFSSYFSSKIDTIRDKLSLENKLNLTSINPVKDTSPNDIKSLSEFKNITIEGTQNLLTKSAPKSCDLDPIPTTLLKEYENEIVPVITKIINSSLHEAVVPHNLKQALISPTIKKHDLDREITLNYRPISNLAFISKLIEKTISLQLHDHLNENNLCEKLQSAYKAGHSTETALLKVQNNIWHWTGTIQLY